MDSEFYGDDSNGLHNILIDSGADASIFPSSLLDKGRQAHGSVGRLCDAQGVEIPVAAVQDMEIRLKDTAGRTILMREKVVLSDRVTQPILCYGHLLGASMQHSRPSVTQLQMLMCHWHFRASQ